MTDAALLKSCTLGVSGTLGWVIAIATAIRRVVLQHFASRLRRVSERPLAVLPNRSNSRRLWEKASS